MDHVNDDMDELFRKAGELYPLKTSESDWDGMLGKLRDEISGETGIPNAVPVRNRSTRRRWLLLMLVPAFIFSLVYFNGSRIKKKSIQTADKTHDFSGNKKNSVTRKISSPSEKAGREIPTDSGNQPKSTGNAAATTQISAGNSKTDVQTNSKSAQNLSSQTDISKDASESGKITRNAALFQSSAAQTNNVSNLGTFHEPVQKPLFLNVYGLHETPSVFGLPFPPSAQNDVTLNPETADAAKTKTNKTASSKGIYVALIGGPDWSTVALQSTEQAGYSLGLLAGYRFNKRISVETGLLWDKKNYYSDGSYFDKSKTTIPQNVDIQTLDGYCNMFEIPLNFRYDFVTRTNHGFFATMGFSSYIMKKEYYSYTADVYYPTYPPQTKTFGKPYYNSSNYFLSIVHLSAGYEYSIGKNTNIRIEPYVKIPLQGIGVGNMPISSAGLYFGISHSFH